VSEFQGVVLFVSESQVQLETSVDVGLHEFVALPVEFSGFSEGERLRGGAEELLSDFVFEVFNVSFVFSGFGHESFIVVSCKEFFIEMEVNEDQIIAAGHQVRKFGRLFLSGNQLGYVFFQGETQVEKFF